MSKWANDLVMDAALDLVATSTRLFACSQQPATYAEAAATYNLATITIDGTAFTKANGATDGRKFTVAQQTGTISASGTVTHVALGIAASSTLLYVTTCDSQALTAGNTLTIPAFSDTIRDPA